MHDVHVHVRARRGKMHTRIHSTYVHAHVRSRGRVKRRGLGLDVRTTHQSLQERFNADDVDWETVDANGTRIQIVDFEGVHVYGMSGSSTD